MHYSIVKEGYFDDKNSQVWESQVKREILTVDSEAKMSRTFLASDHVKIYFSSGKTLEDFQQRLSKLGTCNRI
ncbi:hypothetical protein H1S01_11660 [Heliobacterium chlorum]|uniref:Uncharacterized protein n=1 Tax=Heliobacterium chlorum TaxID=2698 RepID=A0ABR7T320_HELCL|nr:hypothetical protein [Heliobacterium chlorum]MBC9785165.1 hypothetical protein [Heliobacterium chlorum]